MARLTDSEVTSIVMSEIQDASGYSTGDLANERAAAMDYYLGDDYGDEQEGRSQIKTREVLDTIESILPSLCRIFTDSENMVSFDAVGPEDEDQARQETDRVNHAFWKQNRGFYNIYTFCKDALLSKTGNLKIWWEDGDKPEREEYQNLNEYELSNLVNEEGVDREIIEFEDVGGTYNVTFMTTHNLGKISIEPVTPEEFGINSDARSPYAQDATFCYHRVRKTYGDLVAMGYSRKKLDALPSGDDVDTEERLSRRYLSDEENYADDNPRRKTFWITEAYIHLDRDDDGIEELLKVTLATGAQTIASSGTLLDIEEVDAMPFFTASPNIITHKFYGLSIADLVMDLQRIKSTLVRQVLDNAYHANNARTAVNERVNLDDLMTNRPGGIVRVEGYDNIAGSVQPLVSSPLPAETFGLIEYLDELRKQRTGASDEVPALDSKSLASVNASVAAIAYDQARSRLELIARVLAEVGLKPAFLRIHELLQKNQDKAEVVKLRNKWVEVLPSEWKTRKNMTVHVGIGNASRESRLMALDQIGQKQAAVVQGGGFGTLLLPQHIYSHLEDYTVTLGFEASRYFQDPSQLPPKPPEQPSLEQQALMAQAQAQMGMVRVEEQKVQVEAAKVQSQERIRIAEMQNNQTEIQLRQQLERLRGAQDTAIAEMKIASDQEKAAIQADIKIRDQEIRIAESRLKDHQEDAKREVDILKAVMASNTTLTAEQMKLLGVEQPEEVEEVKEDANADVKAMLGELQAMILENRDDGPKEIMRDDNGLVISVGNRTIERDASGKAVRVV